MQACLELIYGKPRPCKHVWSRYTVYRDQTSLLPQEAVSRRPPYMYPANLAGIPDAPAYLPHLCAVRKIIAYKSYFSDFMQALSKPEADKVLRALDLLRTEERLPRHYIKYVREGLYEFRVSHGNNEFRLFFIYDGDTIVVLFNCFKKKTQRTPHREIEKALRLRKEYDATKRDRKG